MKHTYNKFFFIATTLLIFGCNSGTKQEDQSAEKIAYIKQQNPVEIETLALSNFKKQLVSNGILKAINKSDLKFRVNGEIESLLVKNGDWILSGSTIASLHRFEYEQNIEKSVLQLKSTYLQFQDIIIGQGYNPSDSANIPPHIWEMALVRSGYSAALNDHKTAIFNLHSTVLKSPFAGKVANIKQKIHEQVNSGQAFCTLIDDSEFEVEFHLVESEIGQIALNDEVQVIPFSLDKMFRGQVSEINPQVNENGLVQVKARVRNQGGLMEGMNVKVLIEKDIPGQLVVPKSAVVLRDNQEVLFKCQTDTAIWVYVKTLHENSSSYSVIADPDKGGLLEAGEKIITSGNLNLAHESIVVVK